MLNALKIKAILVFGQVGSEILPMAQHVDKLDRQSKSLDLLLKKDDGWHGYTASGGAPSPHWKGPWASLYPANDRLRNGASSSWARAAQLARWCMRSSIVGD